MSQNYPPPMKNEVFSKGRLVIFLIALGLLGFIVYNYYWGGMGESNGYTNVPKEVLVKYVPSDFKSNINEEDALPILSNPQRYSREFEAMIYEFNLSLLDHVANRMNLSDSLKAMVHSEYDKHHPYVFKLMYEDFVSMKDTSSILYNTWYGSEMTTAVDLLNEVAGKYTCFLVTQIFGTLLKTEEGRIYINGKDVDTPCGVAMAEGLKPMIERLRAKAAIEDFSRSKGILNERVERTIAELGTMEIRDRKGIATAKQTKVLGFDVSSTEMEMSAISILKVGFKIDKYFDISLKSSDKTVTVVLPEPEIISHEVFPKIDKLDIGWMREIKQEDFNKNMDLLRREFRQDAIESDVMNKAKERAVELMETILMPIVKGVGPDYKLRVRFKNTGSLPMGSEVEINEKRASIIEKD
ncbi:MAG: DUF4230 domain-containing protein [Saprospiraceae bacterium]